MKENIGVIGEENFISGFRGVGIDIFCVQDFQEARHILEKLVKEEYAIIYVTETYAQGFMEVIQQLNKVYHSSIVIIPGAGIDKKLGEQKLKNIIRKAVGSEVISSEKEN